MKKILLFALITVCMASCSDDNGGESVPTSDVDDSGLTLVPDAKIEFNDSNYGIYKGVFTGSSGVVTVDLFNDDTATATLVVDGTTYNFTSAETVALDQAVTGFTFTSGANSFDFNVSASGTSPTITNIVLDGHPDAHSEIIKEYSDALVRCYQGTFSGEDTGDFNLIRIENSLYGLAKPITDENSYWLEGAINTNLRINGAFDAGNFTGYVNGAALSGNWENSSSQSGTWTGNRTL
jgi:hypothetical protein